MTKKLPTNRSFALVMVVALSLIAAVMWLKGSVAYVYAGGAAIGFAMAGIFVPSILTPLNRLWMRLGELLHRVMSPLVLGAIFFLAVMPFGLAMKLFGRDVMRRKYDPEAASYWVQRKGPLPDRDSLRNQY